MAISWSDAVLLQRVLLRDPSSWVGASAEGWQYPVTHEWILARSQHNNWLSAHSERGKFQPWPAPWDTPALRVTNEADRDLIVAEIDRRLAAHYKPSS